MDAAMQEHDMMSNAWCDQANEEDLLDLFGLGE